MKLLIVELFILHLLMYTDRSGYKKKQKKKSSSLELTTHPLSWGIKLTHSYRSNLIYECVFIDKCSMRTTLLIQQLCVCSVRVLNGNSPWQALIKIKGKLLEIGQAAVDIFVDKDPHKKRQIYLLVCQSKAYFNWLLSCMGYKAPLMNAYSNITEYTFWITL